MLEKIERREFLKFLITSGIVLTSAGSMVPLLSGCKKGNEIGIDKVYNFLDHLDEAEIITAKKEHVKRSAFTIGGSTRKVLYAHPVSQVTFREIPIDKNSRLTFGIGINEPAWEKGGDGVLFEIFITDEKSKKHSIYSRYIDPKNNLGDRKWLDVVVDLKAFEGEKVSFTFKTSSGPKENKASDWAGWNEPRIISTVRKKIECAEKINVILITADTLRADYLNCYGRKNIDTPNIDKLASQGVVFRNCFCQSSTTNPSHASILTSLYPKDHRVHTNTDCLPEELRMISEDMQDQGFNTFATVSASHLNPKISGFGRGFNTFITCEKPQVIACYQQECFYLAEGKL